MLSTSNSGLLLLFWDCMEAMCGTVHILTIMGFGSKQLLGACGFLAGFGITENAN